MVGFLILIELLLMVAVPILLIIWFIFLILKKKHKLIGISILICIAAFFVIGIGAGTLLEQEEATPEVPQKVSSDKLEDNLETHEGQILDWSDPTIYPWGQIVDEVLESIGVTDISSVTCETESFGSVTLKVDTDRRSLWISIDEDVDNVWSVEWTRDYEETSKYYYTAFDWNHIDLYSYETGKLIKEASYGSSRMKPYKLTAQELATEINSNIDAAKAKYNGKWVQITGKVTDYSRYSSDNLSGYYLYGKYGGEGLKIVCWQNKGALKQFDKVGDTCTCIGQVREVTTVNSTEIVNCEIIFE